MRLGRHGAGNRDTTPLPAGQLGRHPVDVFTEPDEPQHLRYVAPNLVEREIGLFVQAVANVLGHRQRIEQGALLKQHADVAANAQKLVLGQVVHSFAVHENRAAVGPKESERKLQHNGFSSTARAEQHVHASLRHAEADVAQHDVLVEGERNLVEHHGR